MNTKTCAKRVGLSLLLAGLFLLLACSNGGDRIELQARDIETLDTNDQDVVFWYQHTREREDELLKLIDEFNLTNPYGITVRGEYAGKYSDIYNKMIVGLQGGTLPNLVVAYQNQARAYYRAEGVVDLNPYINSARWGLKPEEWADVCHSFMIQDRIDGAQIAFPPNRSMEVLYYNIDWLWELGYDRPPQTWGEFAEMCRRARRQPFSKSADSNRSLGFLLEIDASRLASMVFSRGGDFFDAARNTYTLDTPEMRESLGLMRELIQEGAVGLMGEEYGDQREFSVGQVLFVLRSSSGLPFFRSAVEEDGVGFRWDVTHPPAAGTPVINVYGASISVCKTTPAAQLASWLFLKWFTEPAQQARWVRASNYFPVRKSAVRELDEYFAQTPQYRSAFELLEYGKSEPSVEGYQQVRRLIQDAMIDILNGEDMDRTLGDLQRAANRTLLDF